MNKDFEKEVLKKFDTVIKLLTISSLKGEKQLEKIKILSGEGLPPKEIADLLGTSANTVSVALNKLKKKTNQSQEDKQEPTENVGDNSND
jgi:DNA-binding NarL/FixJ family response regulator